MRYVLLIHVDEKQWEGMTTSDQETLMAAYFAFGERYKDKIQGGEALREVATATMVRVRDGKTLTTDGPFAETKEQLNGFYVVDAEHLDEAVAIAAEIPDAVRGAIEVRPAMVFDQA